MKRNSTLVCKVLFTTFTIFTLHFNTVAAPCIGYIAEQVNTTLPEATTSSTGTKYEFASIAPGISATITVLNKIAATSTNSKSVNIQWITEFDQAETHFEVERSFDMTNFTTVAIVLDGFTTGITQKTFQLKDNSSELKGKKLVYYRLKQLDPAGSGTACKILTVVLEQ